MYYIKIFPHKTTISWIRILIWNYILNFYCPSNSGKILKETNEQILKKNDVIKNGCKDGHTYIQTDPNSLEPHKVWVHGVRARGQELCEVPVDEGDEFLDGKCEKIQSAEQNQELDKISDEDPISIEPAALSTEYNNGADMRSSHQSI